MKFYLINQDGANVVDIENTNESINNALKWDDAWNTPIYQVGGNRYVFICCDTGKMRQLPISCLSITNIISPKETIREPFIVGATIITKFDGIDDFEGLNDDDIKTLMAHTIDVKDAQLNAYKKILLID